MQMPPLTHPPRPAFPPAAGVLNEGSFFSCIIGLFSISSVIDLNSWGVKGLNFRHLALWWWEEAGVWRLLGLQQQDVLCFVFLEEGLQKRHMMMVIVS